AAEHEDRQRLLPRHPEDARDVEAGQERAAHVRDALPVERPARLLVEVRGAELPEYGRRRRHKLSARAGWRAESSRVPSRGDTACKVGLSVLTVALSVGAAIAPLFLF